MGLITQRKKAGLTQMQVAQALGITDMSDWLPEHSKWWIERAEEIEKRLGETK